MKQVELYDQRFDWLVASLAAFPLVWLFYGFDAAFLSMPFFALIGALKPLVRSLGSRLSAGIFAAGAVLVLSPMLRFIFPSGYCFDGPLSVLAGFNRYAYVSQCAPSLFGDIGQDLWVGPIRDVAMPIAGIGLMLLIWLNKGDGRADGQAEEAPGDVASGVFSLAKFRPWAILLSAIPIWAGVSYWNYDSELAAAEAELKVEMARQAEEAAAAAKEADRLAAEKAAKRVDRAFLVGAWASIESGNIDPSIYCGTDAGFTFKNDSTFTAASAEGRFSLKDNEVLLTDRTSFEIGEPDAPAERLDPETLKVERNGMRLIIDGVTYGRC